MAQELLTAVALVIQWGALFQVLLILEFLQLRWCGLTAAGRPAAEVGGVRTAAVVVAAAAPVTVTTGPGTWTQNTFFFWTTVALEQTARNRNSTVTMRNVYLHYLASLPLKHPADIM